MIHQGLPQKPDRTDCTIRRHSKARCNCLTTARTLPSSARAPAHPCRRAGRGHSGCTTGVPPFPTRTEDDQCQKGIAYRGNTAARGISCGSFVRAVIAGHVRPSGAPPFGQPRPLRLPRRQFGRCRRWRLIRRHVRLGAARATLAERGTSRPSRSWRTAARATLLQVSGRGPVCDGHEHPAGHGHQHAARTPSVRHRDAGHVGGRANRRPGRARVDRGGGPDAIGGRWVTYGPYSRRRPHTPARPTFRCRSCGAHWPCGAAKLVLLDIYRRDPRGVLGYLAGQLRYAMQDMPDVDPAILTARIVNWVPRPRPTAPGTGPRDRGTPRSEPD